MCLLIFLNYDCWCIISPPQQDDLSPRQWISYLQEKGRGSGQGENEDEGEREEKKEEEGERGKEKGVREEGAGERRRFLYLFSKKSQNLWGEKWDKRRKCDVEIQREERVKTVDILRASTMHKTHQAAIQVIQINLIADGRHLLTDKIQQGQDIQEEGKTEQQRSSKAMHRSKGSGGASLCSNCPPSGRKCQGTPLSWTRTTGR